MNSMRGGAQQTDLMANGCTNMSNIGAPWELDKWLHVDEHRCSCAPHSTLAVKYHLKSGDAVHSSVPMKTCSIPMPRQGLRHLNFSGPAGEAPAYPAFEIDGGFYGKDLRKALGGHRLWIDIGANLGTLSVALALANPTARGWAFEPNPVTFAFLERNIQANGLAHRIEAINAGITADGRSIYMPRCVLMHPGGSQMASTQWSAETGGPASNNRCFSGSCKHKAEKVRECMRDDPSMVPLKSVALTDALAKARGRGGGVRTLGLLKVDCEGCEHEVMEMLEHVRTNGAVSRITGECHPLNKLEPSKVARCLKVLRGQECNYGISPWMTCNPPPRAKPRATTSLSKNSLVTKTRAGWGPHTTG